MGARAPKPRPETWLEVRPAGLFCRPGGFFVDPVRPVPRAVVSHGHADHARAGHAEVIATAETLAIMAARLGEGCFGQGRALAYGEVVEIGEVTLWLAPAGHVLGSAQIVIEYRGTRVVVSGDYKRQPDPTCAPFRAIACDLFVTEATFALPVFRHPDPAREVAKLLHTRELFPGRAILVGAYALGKAQRLIAMLRAAGYDRPIRLHGALEPMCALYARHGVSLGELRPVGDATGPELAGEIVLAPPSALAGPWSRRLPDPLPALASGWMGLRRHVRARGVELPLVISDHADWDALLATCAEVEAPEVWITHGREEALAHALQLRGIRAKALARVGHEEEA